jgi:hypothetical protein
LHGSSIRTHQLRSFSAYWYEMIARDSTDCRALLTLRSGPMRHPEPSLILLLVKFPALIFAVFM